MGTCPTAGDPPQNVPDSVVFRRLPAFLAVAHHHTGYGKPSRRATESARFDRPKAAALLPAGAGPVVDRGCVRG